MSLMKTQEAMDYARAKEAEHAQGIKHNYVAYYTDTTTRPRRHSRGNPYHVTSPEDSSPMGPLNISRARHEKFEKSFDQESGFPGLKSLQRPDNDERQDRFADAWEYPTDLRLNRLHPWFRSPGA